MFADFKTEIKLLFIVAFIAVVVSVAGIFLLKTMQPPSIEEQVGVFDTEEVYTSLTINVLNDEDVFNILNSFADQEEYLKIEDFGAKDLLKNAAQKGNHDIKNRIKEVREKFEVRLNEGLEDAPHARAVSLVHTKLCVAESIVSNDLQRTTEICGIPENPSPDDITASMQVLPYFVAGMAYYVDDNKERAVHYFSKITSHKQAIVEQYGEGSLDTAGAVYKMILDKVEKLSASDLSILSTSDWQTYRDSFLDIEFIYPNNWKVEKLHDTHGLIEGPDFSKSIPLSSEASPYKGTVVNFGLSLENHNPQGHLLDYFKDLTQRVVSMHTAPNDKISTTYIGGREAVRWDTHNQGFAPPGRDFASTHYYVLHKGKFFQISKVYSIGEYEETFNQILATFRFVE